MYIESVQGTVYSSWEPLNLEGVMQRAEYEYMYNWLVVTLVVCSIRERGGN